MDILKVIPIMDSQLYDEAVYLFDRVDEEIYIDEDDMIILEKHIQENLEPEESGYTALEEVMLYIRREGIDCNGLLIY